MKKLFILSSFLLFGASFSLNANTIAETAITVDCTVKTKDGKYSVTAPTCDEARKALKCMLGIA